MITYYLKSPNALTETPIMMAIHVRGRRARMSTDEVINPTHWNQGKNRPRQNAPRCETLTTYLDRLEHRAKEVALRLKADFATITPDAVKEALQRDLELGGRRQTFVDFVDKYIQTAEAERTRPEGSLQVYRSMLKLLKSYPYAKDFNDITPDWFRKYQAWLEGVKVSDDQTGYSLNYIGKNVSIIRELMTIALGKGAHKNLAYKSTEYKRPKEEVETIALTMDELMAIYKAELSPALDNHRNRFLIQAFTCLRFSDQSRITWDKVRDGMLYERSKKTRSDVAIPVHPILQRIIDSHPNGLPPACSNARSNRALKEIAKKANITGVVVVHKTLGGKPIEIPRQRWEMVSTHTGRRTGATLLYLSKVPKKVIMELGGWKSETSFDKYIRIDKLTHIDILKNSTFYRDPLAE